MKKWLLEKRWRILLAGFLTVALPLVGLTIYVYLQVISQFRQIAVEETRTFFDLAVYHVEEKINDDISSRDDLCRETAGSRGIGERRQEDGPRIS